MVQTMMEFNKPQTQVERLRNWLLVNRSITPLEAWNTLGIYRLASRIHDLHKAGMRIDSKMVNVTNRYGETFRVAEYRMEA